MLVHYPSLSVRHTARSDRCSATGVLGCGILVLALGGEALLQSVRQLAASFLNTISLHVMVLFVLALVSRGCLSAVYDVVE